MNVTVIIPARLQSTRLPNKMLLPINGRPLIAVTAEAAKKAGYRTIVATDSEAIGDACGCEFVLTPPTCNNGTERVAWAANHLRLSGIVVNVQGDELHCDPDWISQAVNKLYDRCDVSTLITKLDGDASDPARVKAMVTPAGKALWFSRHDHSPWLHIGVYGFWMQSLNRYAAAPVSQYERESSLEQLRAIEIGLDVQCVAVPASKGGIDTMADYLSHHKT